MQLWMSALARKQHVPVDIWFLSLLSAGALLIAGCGSDSDETEHAEPERAEETLDKLPELERGYEEFVNSDVGVAIGRPPGWKAQARGALTTLTAPDELVLVSISINRTDDALDLDPDDFADQTAAALEGFKDPVMTAEPKEFEHRYEGAEVRGKGVVRNTGVGQTVQVIVLEREDVAVVTAVVFANSERNTSAAAKQALEAIESLRSRPPP